MQSPWHDPLAIFGDDPELAPSLDSPDVTGPIEPLLAENAAVGAPDSSGP